MLLALAALSTPLVGGPAGGWPRPLVLPRAAVSSHSSSEPSALSHGVGRGGGAVRRRSWSSENRAVRWSPSGCRAVTSRAPRRATFPHFLAWRGNGSSSPGREKGGRPPEVRGALEVRGAPEVRGARVLSRDCPPRPGAPGRGAPLREVPAREAPSTERPPEGRALEGRALEGRALEGRLGEPDGRPEALERGDAGRADPPERADGGLADGRADVLERGDDALAAPLFPMSGTCVPRAPPVEQILSIPPTGPSDYSCCAPAGHPSWGLLPRAMFPPPVEERPHSSEPWGLPACPFHHRFFHRRRRQSRTHCAPKGRDERVEGNQQAFWGV